jgi:hypothetical protein
MFVWISVVQMAIGMWRYHSLQYAIQAAGAYTTVHGTDCTSCKIQIKDAAKIIQSRAPGIDPKQLTVWFNTVASDHLTTVNVAQCTLDQCLESSTVWPPQGSNSPGQEISIEGKYLFKSALSMFAPGSGSVKFGNFYLPGYTHQIMTF